LNPKIDLMANWYRYFHNMTAICHQFANQNMQQVVQRESWIWSKSHYFLIQTLKYNVEKIKYKILKINDTMSLHSLQVTNHQFNLMYFNKQVLYCQYIFSIKPVYIITVYY